MDLLSFLHSRSTCRNTLEPLPQRHHRLLEVVRIPELHRRIYALPPNEDGKRLTHLMLVF